MADVGHVENNPFGAIYSNEGSEYVTFTAAGANTYPAALLLGRITATGKMIPYAPAAVDGSEVPTAVLLKELVTTGAGDTTLYVMTAGRTREAETRVWDGGTPIALTDAERDALRAAGIEVVKSTSMGFHDNS